MAGGGKMFGGACRAGGVPSGTAKTLAEAILAAECCNRSPSCVQAPAAICDASAAPAPPAHRSNKWPNKLLLSHRICSSCLTALACTYRSSKVYTDHVMRCTDQLRNVWF